MLVADGKQARSLAEGDPPCEELHVLSTQAPEIGPRSTASVLTEALRLSIVRGVLRGGDRLTQDAVASRYKVSQTVVREAFRQLAAERLLVAEPRRGFFVSELSVQEADEITNLRSLIEPQALRWALPAIAAPTIATASALLDEIDRTRETDDLIRLNDSFHVVLYEPCERVRTLEAIGALRLGFERYLRFAWTTTDHIEKSQLEHRRILALCEEGDASQACHLLRDHILGTGEQLAASLRRQLR